MFIYIKVLFLKKNSLHGPNIFNVYCLKYTVIILPKKEKMKKKKLPQAESPPHFKITLS